MIMNIYFFYFYFKVAYYPTNSCVTACPIQNYYTNNPNNTCLPCNGACLNCVYIFKISFYWFIRVVFVIY